MIKDVLVDLSVGKPRDVAGDFAVSAAALFGAHVSGIAFAQEPPIETIDDGEGRRQRRILRRPFQASAKVTCIPLSDPERGLVRFDLARGRRSNSMGVAHHGDSP